MLNLNDWSPPSTPPWENEVTDDNRNELLESPSSLIIDVISNENEAFKTDLTALEQR